MRNLEIIPENSHTYFPEYLRVFKTFLDKMSWFKRVMILIILRKTKKWLRYENYNKNFFFATTWFFSSTFDWNKNYLCKFENMKIKNYVEEGFSILFSILLQLHHYFLVLLSNHIFSSTNLLYFVQFSSNFHEFFFLYFHENG